jgi:uncharacterized protein YdhG (YjbR/CyaY superfamily)
MKRVFGRKEVMPAKPKTIDDYLARVGDAHRAALEKLRRDIQAAVPSAEECISYDMPGFRLGSRVLVIFGTAKTHCAFYPGAQPIRAHKDELARYDLAKGTIRFPAEKPLSARLVKKLVKTRVAQYSGKPSNGANRYPARVYISDD